MAAFKVLLLLSVNKRLKIYVTQVSLVAIGPLTNLALAIRLDPSFPQKLKDLYIMGGNKEGKTSINSYVSSQSIFASLFFLIFTGIGNSTLCAEFNFEMDPESAYIVLEEFLCPTYVATWEYSCRNSLPWVSHGLVMNYTTPYGHV